MKDDEFKVLRRRTARGEIGCAELDAEAQRARAAEERCGAQRDALLIAVRDVLAATTVAGQGTDAVPRALTHALLVTQRVQDEIAAEAG